jgi:hypothetical protein
LEYGPGRRAIVTVEEDIAAFYRSLIPKYEYARAQKYDAHITVVRFLIDEIRNIPAWEKHAGEVIKFHYEPIIHKERAYFYIDVSCERIGDIREELGLPRFRMNELGASRGKYHFTIANRKHFLPPKPILTYQI